MLLNLEINGRKVTGRRDETILELLTRNGIRVPTLCTMPGFTPTGSCRMCVVEVEGRNDLVPSCSQPVEEWMRIWTHTPRVNKARKTLVELLLANHPDDCMYCNRSGLCELQDLSDELLITDRKFMTRKKPAQIDGSCPSIERDISKCILCNRCVRVCDEIIGVSAIEIIGRGSNSAIGTGFNKGLNEKACVKCGQCIMVCPTDALKETPSHQKIIEALSNKDLHCVIQISPSVLVSVGDELGLKSGKDVIGYLRSALYRIGFKQVFETAFAADITITETAHNFVKSFREHKLPVFTSCCPSWVRYIEEFMPELKENLSPSLSPQQMMGKLIKDYYGPRTSIPGKNIFSVAVMPCTAKKYEAEKNLIPGSNNRVIDAVITSREFVKLINFYGIDFSTMEPEVTENYFSMQSSAGRLVGTAGGTLEL
jgi:iron-only hydrogenase group A